ncbi:Branched-chain amino acid transport system permease protein LivM [Dehalobacter sp. UNSWDHB]|uniref:branched-chain amino acid ABC transporter permease n=1 Tax=unclassified Dehalobacter TaxID=2635733 RepID=UPI00028A4EF3|nr:MULTISPECIES: branched-chain amino acid ABC transporter permease [unclassified Dehalobacter]AFV03596.1 Branched-chain amino acid transport system permease protein LivM [Dehalobacter sp. DCA]AFV06582.1 Branched-chain amino acid transport system permease protein LivM [Dehalobacter sp. CF]EQB20254.1 Branched-chain amino acid transport system permease protein LivM [Dehalobacter sp. UNSWDHB]
MKKIIFKFSGAVIMLVLLIIPLLLNSNYLYGLLIVIGLYAIVVQGLGILMGYAGQVSFGHAAFFGLGAYTAAILTTRFHWPSLLALLAAILLPGIVAALIGRQTLKLRELYLALATLGFGILVHILFTEGGEITGGPSGISGIPHLGIGSLILNSDRKFYILIWIILVLILLGIRNLVRSRTGRALCAIRESEYAAENAGIDCVRLKLQAFIFSALLTGLAGGLYAFYMTFISPSPFTFHASVQFVLMAVIGGLGTFWGPLLGAVVVVALNEILKELIPLIVPGAGGEYQIIIYGIILVALMIYRPQGLSSIGEFFQSSKKSLVQDGNEVN